MILSVLVVSEIPIKHKVYVAEFNRTRNIRIAGVNFRASCVTEKSMSEHFSKVVGSSGYSSFLPQGNWTTWVGKCGPTATESRCCGDHKTKYYLSFANISFYALPIHIGVCLKYVCTLYIMAFGYTLRNPIER